MESKFYPRLTNAEAADILRSNTACDKFSQVRAGDHDPRVYALSMVKASDPGNEYFRSTGSGPQPCTLYKKSYRVKVSQTMAF